jgi:2,3-bisphosphoglycerate-dependent phosphoglycerate mutase
VSQPLADSAEDVVHAMRSLERQYLLGVEGVTEVWLVRHADVYDGLAEVHDPPLSARGRDEAARLAQRLRRLPVAAVYASPARRAQQTARELTDEIRLDARLGEASAKFTGGRLAVEERVPDIVARMRAAVDDAVAAHPAARVVMIGHGIAILNYLADLLQLSPGTLRLYPPFTGVSIVRAHADRRAVGTLFDVSHLEART